MNRIELREQTPLGPIEQKCFENIANNAEGSTNTRERATNEASGGRVLPGAPQSEADIFCRQSRRGYRSWDFLGGWRGPETPRRLQRRGYSNRTSKLNRDLVGARVVCAAKKDNTWVCDGLVNVGGAADGLFCAKVRRISPCGCSGSPVSREWWISPVNEAVDSTA